MAAGRYYYVRYARYIVHATQLAGLKNDLLLMRVSPYHNARNTYIQSVALIVLTVCF